jgi:hypothetical protein
MKFKPKKSIEIGEKRIIKKFAFFPITEWIPNNQTKFEPGHYDTSAKKGQARWLEFVYIEQVRIEGLCGGLGGTVVHWSNLRFVTKEEYEKYAK